MDFRILGPLEVRDDEDRAIAFGGAKQRALLGALLLHANEVVSTDRLIADLWGEHPPSSAPKALQVHVSQLRKALEPGGSRRVVVTRPPGYLIRLEPEQLDLHRFARLVEGAKGLPVPEAARRLQEALRMWRGPPLADLEYETFAQGEIARLEEMRLSALEERIEADLGLGRHADLIGELEALIAEHPTRERLRGQLMIALYRCERQTEALEHYGSTRRFLVQELGIEPGRALRELHQAILNQDASLDVRSLSPEARQGEPAIMERRPEEAFVGRGHELSELAAAFQGALHGAGAIVLVGGEPGIGKTALAGELAGRAEGAGARVLWGRCWEAGGAPAYWPWVQALRSYVRDRDAEILRAELGRGGPDIAQILPELQELLPGLSPPPDPDSDGARFRLFDAVAALLRAASEHRPLVIVLDDLHAADAPSLMLLRFLAGQLGGARVLVIGNYREIEVRPDHPFSTAMTEVARAPGARLLSLSGLSQAEVGRLVELRLDATPPESLVAAIGRRTGGNPLFIGEVLRSVGREAIAEILDDPRSVVIPHRVHEAIGRRLGHLSQRCVDTLTLASVLGREFDLAPLARVSGLSVDELYNVLDEALAEEVIGEAPSGAGRLRFAHALIRDTLYDELTPPRRAQLHRQAAEALESLFAADPEPHLAELAYHFLAAIPAAPAARAVEYATRAGDRALVLLAYEEAARQYASALDALELGERPDRVRQCELLLALGDAELRAGAGQSAKGAFLRAADHARAEGTADQLARAALGYGTRYIWPRAADPKIIKLLEEALEALGEGDSAPRVRVMTRLACALRPARERPASLSRDAVAMARRLGDLPTLAYALDGRYAAIWWPETTEERLAIASELADVAERADEPERQTTAVLARLISSMELADLDAAQAAVQELGRIADELRQPARRWMAAAPRALLALAVGRFDAAESLIEQAYRVGAGHDESTAAFCRMLQSFLLHRERGELEDVADEVEGSVDDFPHYELMLWSVVADLRVQLGREDEARRALARVASDAFGGLPRDSGWLFALTLAADVCGALDDERHAAELYDLLLPFEGRLAVSPVEAYLGTVSRALGVAATTNRLWREGEAHFERALETDRALGARPWIAHDLHDFARMLAARAGPGDAERARRLAMEAVDAYRELQMAGWAERALPLAEAAVPGPG